MTDKIQIDRHKRRLILGLTGVLGAAAATELTGGSALSTALAYQPRTEDEQTDAPGKLFSLDQLHTLQAICQMVIPKTNTLGAGDVDVHGFIDNQLFHCFDQAEQTRIVSLIDAINQQAKTSFNKLAQDDQHRLLTRIDKVGLPGLDSSHGDFRFLKSLICFGYFTSEEGASKVLTYLPFPGGFKGSVPYHSIGRAFGSHAYY